MSKKGKVTSNKGGKIVIIPGQDKNVTDLSKILAESIQLTDNSKKNSVVDHAKVAEAKGFLVDESNEDCQIAKTEADTLMENIKKHSDLTRKSTILPLQGNLWKTWSQLDKEEVKKRNMGTMQPEEYSDFIREKKKAKRNEQSQIKRSKEIQSFITALCSYSVKRRKFFLIWCQLGLNAISELLLPGVLK